MLSPASAVSLAIVAALAVGFGDREMDRLVGHELNFTLFYLGPVGLATWYAGPWGIVIITITCTVVWYLADAIADGIQAFSLVPLWNSLIRMAVFLIFATLLYALRRRYVQAVQLGETDPLTGTLNRRAFGIRLKYNLDLARRSGTGLTLAYVDVDDFKRLNDLYGHAVGDHLLKELGHALMADMRRTDSVARLGGDEFAFILPSADLKTAEELIAKIRHRIKGSMVEHGVRVTCSIGAVTFRDSPPNVEAAIHATDALMYEAKHRGKDAVVFGTFDARRRKVVINTS